MFKKTYRFLNAFLAEIVSLLSLDVAISIVRNHYDFVHNCVKDSMFIFGVTGIIVSSLACLILLLRLIGRAVDDDMDDYYVHLECTNCNRLASKLTDARKETEKLKDTVINLTAKID